MRGDDDIERVFLTTEHRGLHGRYNKDKIAKGTWWLIRRERERCRVPSLHSDTAAVLAEDAKHAGDNRAFKIGSEEEPNSQPIIALGPKRSRTRVWHAPGVLQ